MKILKEKLQVAIDGPVAAGKGAVSKILASRLDILYIDTGAMYRALALFVKNNNISWKNEDDICRLLKKQKPLVDLRAPKVEENDGRLVTVLLNNKDVSWAIRTEEVSWGVSTITRYKCVRSYMLPLQQDLARKRSVVMEGRDITTRVLPLASLRIYMDAKSKVRAQRRHRQLLERGEDVRFQDVFKAMEKRDSQDMNRKHDPLEKTAGVWVLNTTSLTIEEVVDKVLKKIKERGLEVY